MAPITSELHSMNRRQQILAAAETVLLERGIDNFTMDQVVQHAGIAKGTIYKYFKSKDEVLAVLSSKALSMLLVAFKNDTAKYEHSVDKLRELCMSSFRFYIKNKVMFNLITYMERPEFEIDMKDYVQMSGQLQDFCESIVVEGQRKGEINPNLNSQSIQLTFWATCVGVVQFLESKKKILRNYHDIKLKDLMEVYSGMITEGIR